MFRWRNQRSLNNLIKFYHAIYFSVMRAWIELKKVLFYNKLIKHNASHMDDFGKICQINLASQKTSYIDT